MSGQLVASLTLKYQDQGSSAAEAALQKVKRSLKDVEGQAKTTSAAAVTAFKRMSEAREVLGIRSEKAIQNEIRQTEAAYRRLAQSGTASARELARAQEAMRQRVAGLRQELDGVSRSAGGAGGALTKALAVIGAWHGAKAVLGQPLQQTMSYDRSLANLANTAYAGQSMNARRAGMRTLDAAIQASVRSGGGTREASMATLDKLVASGAFSDVNEAIGLLPVLARGGTAANADPATLADIAIRAKQTFGLRDTGLAIDQAMRAGQLGGFELRDMARWLPQQMAAARQSGLVGESGFRTLLAANQASAITAGSKDEAGNNLVNLLAKINSRDTAMDAQRLGIDLSGSLAAARARGVNSLDAFVSLADQIAGRDSRYVALRSQAANATGADRQAMFGSMADILQGSAVGKIVQDRQALMALLGIMNNRGYMRNIEGQLGSAQGTAASAFGLVEETPSFKAERAAAEKAIAMQAALDRVNPLLGGMADVATEVMREFPGLTAAAVGATTALIALAYAAGGAGLASILTGGRAAGAAGGAAAGAGRIGSWLAPHLAGGWRAAGVAALPLAAIAGAALLAGDPNKIETSESSAGTARGFTGLSGMLSSLFGDPTASARARYEAARADLTGAPQVIQVQIDGQTVATAVNAYNARAAGRH